ncbi:hypothetical protein [Desulfitibacter alkalitolerans]|uniref:hypothetical protein n=1 Tax=Desulfitibacter alkalitolerans TaxID=264641 RepID=UPI000483DD29|nr:hypothetical protein [Desulfitibacter alkalitolerans]
MNNHNQEDNHELPTWIKIINLMLFIVILGGALFIISTDKGKFTGQTSGAGDIWWADIPAIDEAYKELKKRTNTE